MEASPRWSGGKRPVVFDPLADSCATSGGGRGGKGLTRGKQPTGGRGSDTEPSCHVDPIGGCAPERIRFQTACGPTSDPREEPGALAAHAGICAGGEEKSSSLPRPLWSPAEKLGGQTLLTSSMKRN